MFVRIFALKRMITTDTTNPWTRIRLDDYEEHMSLDSVRQLQALDDMMESQLYDYAVASVSILGIAGGNGLRHVDPQRIETVYGIDINETYLQACRERYPGLQTCFRPVCLDVSRPEALLPASELVIADLFIEYVGCEKFAETIHRAAPKIVSCIIQVDPGEDFVSESPYLEKLRILDSVHHTIDPQTLDLCMEKIGYRRCKSATKALPNGKQLCRFDYMPPKRG